MVTQSNDRRQQFLEYFSEKNLLLQIFFTNFWSKEGWKLIFFCGFACYTCFFKINNYPFKFWSPVFDSRLDPTAEGYIKLPIGFIGGDRVDKLQIRGQRGEKSSYDFFDSVCLIFGKKNHCSISIFRFV